MYIYIYIGVSRPSNGIKREIYPALDNGASIEKDRGNGRVDEKGERERER